MTQDIVCFKNFLCVRHCIQVGNQKRLMETIGNRYKYTNTQGNTFQSDAA